MGEIEESFAVLSHGWATPCVALAQGRRDDVQALIFAEVKGDRIQRLDLCMAELYRWKPSSEQPPG